MPSRQEGELFYSERTTRRHRFREFLTNSIKVGVSSYLFYSLFKCFVMFVLIEAVSGRLIGSKSWNRSVGIFEDPFVQPVVVLGTVLGVWMIIY